jgi:hypothetical protein
MYVMAVRLTSLAILVVLGKLLYHWDGQANFDTLFVTSTLLALFAVAQSTAFYISADRGTKESLKHLQDFLSDTMASMRAETRTHIEAFASRFGPAANSLIASANDPTNEEAEFRAFHALLDQTAAQYLILMADQNTEIPAIQRGEVHHEILMPNGGFTMGSNRGQRGILGAYDRTGLVELDSRVGRITDKGRRFARWMTDNGGKAQYFNSDYGSWGTRPAGLPHQGDFIVSQPGVATAAAQVAPAAARVGPDEQVPIPNGTVLYQCIRGNWAVGIDGFQHLVDDNGRDWAIKEAGGDAAFANEPFGGVLGIDAEMTRRGVEGPRQLSTTPARSLEDLKTILAGYNDQ